MSQTALANEDKEKSTFNLSAEQFLKLPGDFQFFYVAGALDGMKLVSSENGLSAYDAFVDCYQSIPLGAFTQKVVVWMRSSATPESSIAELIIQTAENLCGVEISN